MIANILSSCSNVLHGNNVAMQSNCALQTEEVTGFSQCSFGVGRGIQSRGGNVFNTRLYHDSFVFAIGNTDYLREVGVLCHNFSHCARPEHRPIRHSRDVDAST